MKKPLKLNIQLFASAEKSDETYSSAGNKGTIYVSFNENSTNTEKNTSNITVYASFKMTGRFNTPGSTHSLNVYWYDNNKNENVLVQGKTINVMSNGDVLEVGDTIDVLHLPDGSLEGYAWVAWAKQNNNEYVPVSKTVIAEPAPATLTYIPKVTSCPDVQATIGKQYTLTVNPASTSFSHYFRAYFGNDTQEGWFNSSNTLYWTPKNDFMYQIPSSKYGKGTITVYTYYNGVEIGSNSGELTLYANESLATPSISGTVVDTNPTTIALTRNNNKLIKYYSNATITPNIVTKYGASVSNKTVDGTPFTTSTVTLNGATKSVFSLVITDSRGYSNSVSVGSEGNLINYSPLTIKKASFTRPESMSTTATMSLTLNYWNGNFGVVSNTLTGQYRYRESNFGEWSEYVTIPFEINGTEATYTTTFHGFDSKKSYDFQIIAEDALVRIAENEILPKGIEALSIGDNFIATPHIYIIDENTGAYRQIY